MFPLASLPPWVPTLSPGVVFATGTALVVVGTYLRCKLPDHAMDTEDRAKDGTLSEDQARRRMAIARFSGPIMIVLGATAFAVVLLQ